MRGSRLQGFRRCLPRLLPYRDATFGYWLIVSWYRVAILAKEPAVESHVAAVTANLQCPIFIGRGAPTTSGPIDRRLDQSRDFRLHQPRTCQAQNLEVAGSNPVHATTAAGALIPKDRRR